MGGLGNRWTRWAGLAATSSLLFSACSVFRASVPPPSPQPPPAVRPPGVIGVASWYGPGFDGHPTASGEIYDQNDLTAASTMFPLGSRVMVTNLDNQRSVEVTINDRGPFLKRRKIDLSKKAARMLGILNSGTARVQIDLLSAPPGSRPVGSPLRYFVQCGSYQHRDSAERVRDRLATYYRDVHVERLDAGTRRYYRVRMGAFATRSEAASRAASTARFGLPLVIVSE